MDRLEVAASSPLGVIDHCKAPLSISIWKSTLYKCITLLLFILFIYLFIYKHLGMTVHGEQIIGLEVPYKDLSPMVRAAMSEKNPEKLH